MALERRTTLLVEALRFVELVYYTVVREVRDESGNAALGILSAIARILLMVLLFYVIFEVLGLRGAMIRGNTVLFLVTGILLFFMHNTTVNSVVKAGSMVSPMMQHAPMTPMLMIVSGALAQLYLHLLATIVILTGLYIALGELPIQNLPVAAFAFILAWATGIGIGLLFLGLKPFAPSLMLLLSLSYRRANFITSGKFFVANLLPTSALPMFDWNPLFHSIDQARGGTFVNYSPKNTNFEYPIMFFIVTMLIGLMIEAWLRKTVSRSTITS